MAKRHHWIAGIVFILSLLLYVVTIAPTTSFWDCGEFIACSYSLGVPHPPGAPLFLLLGRIFSMLPLAPDIGLRVNLLSALVSALTIMLTYLIIVRLIRKWRGMERTVSDQVIMYGSGVIGALAFATSHSFWWNAVEAEVYAISMFFTALVIWLALRWMSDSDRPSASIYIFLIAYFVGLSTGVHLLNVLALSPIVLLIYFQKYSFSWKGFFIAVAISFAAILVVYPGIVAGIPWLLSKGVFYLVLFILVGIGILVWSLRNRKDILSLVVFSTFLVLVGYSTYSVIYIRSNQNPEINENQPDTVDRLIKYLNREQYGSTGPVEVMYAPVSFQARLKRDGAMFIPLSGDKILRFNILERKAPFWSYQINRMYLRYLRWQFFIGELGQPFLVPFLIGLLGMLWHFYRDWRRGSVIMLLFFMTGLAIVFYLNQDDPQPRERDYAYVGSYFAFALWIGIGVAALFELIEDGLRGKGERARTGVAIGTVALMTALIPVNMLVQSFHTHDRSGNYVAWDYSYNLLETCAPDAMIFTNGDNDTFPLWYLQVVEGIRRDVRVINLSLLNTDWYIKQLRDNEPKQPITLSDDFIDNKLCARTDDALILRYWPQNHRKWSVDTPDGGKMEWEVPASLYINTGDPNEVPGKPNFLRIQDVMILHLIQQNKWKHPVYFAVTVSSSNLVGLSEYLQMEGLAFRLHPKKVSTIDEEIMRKNLLETYADHYRNLNNPDVYLFPNVIKLLQNYRSGFIQLVYEYYRQMPPDAPLIPSGIPKEQWKERFDELALHEKALFMLQTMEQIIPEETVPLNNRDVLLQISRFYFAFGDLESGRAKLEKVLEMSRNNIDLMLQTAFYFNEYAQDPERLKEIIAEVLALNPSVDQMFNIAALYDRAKMKDELEKTLDLINSRPGLQYREQVDLAGYYLTTGSYDKAKALYERLSAQNADDGAVMGGLLELYSNTHDTVAARNLLENWVKNNPGDQRAQDLLEEWK